MSSSNMINNIQDCANAKECAISARLQRRKPFIGEKSSGGKMTTVLSNNVEDYVSFTPVALAGDISHTKPLASTRNMVKVRKHCGIPGVYFAHSLIYGPENPFFREINVFYHHKKDETPRTKTLQNGGTFSCQDLKNDKRRKSNKGMMKRRINISEY